MAQGFFGGSTFLPCVDGAADKEVKQVYEAEDGANSEEKPGASRETKKTPHGLGGAAEGEREQCPVHRLPGHGVGSGVCATWAISMTGKNERTLHELRRVPWTAGMLVAILFVRS